MLGPFLLLFHLIFTAYKYYDNIIDSIMNIIPIFKTAEETEV